MPLHTVKQPTTGESRSGNQATPPGGIVFSAVSATATSAKPDTSPWTDWTLHMLLAHKAKGTSLCILLKACWRAPSHRLS